MREQKTRDRERAILLNSIPPAALLVLTGLFVRVEVHFHFGSPEVLALFSTAIAAVPLLVAVLAIRFFTEQGARILVLIASAMVFPAVGTLLAGWGFARFGWDYSATVHNSGYLLGGACHLAAVAMLYFGSAITPRNTRGRAAVVGGAVFGATVGLVALIAVLTTHGLLPRFFVDGTIPTLVRQSVLTCGALFYVMSGIFVVALQARTGMAFLSLYANALFLCAIAMAGYLGEQGVGTLLNWTARLSLLAASVYFLLAVIKGHRETGGRGSSLPGYLSELLRSRINAEVNARTAELLDLNERLRDEITERREAQERLTLADVQLRETRDKLRNLTAYLLRAREEERRKVAQEVHDELGQTLSAIKMDLHWLEEHVRGAAPTVGAKIREMIGLGEQTIKAVQRISSQLRPRMLDHLGLVPALEWLSSDFSRRTGIACTVDAQIPLSVVTNDAATTLYRVTQEALSNVSLHSRAKRAAVRLRATEWGIVLRIEDDGIGITPDQAASPESFGLIGIHERIEGLGGTVAVAGQSDNGTVLEARIPITLDGKRS